MPNEIAVRVIDRKRKHFYMRAELPDGTRKERSTGIPTGGKKLRREAERVAAVWEAELREGRYQDPLKVSWDEFRERYEEEKLAGLSDNYAAVMNATMNHFEELGVKLLADVGKSLSRFQAHLRGQKVAESTIRCYLKHLRAALGWAHDEAGMLIEVPKFAMPKRARKKSRRMKGRPITSEEFERMLLTCETVCAHDVSGWKRYLTGLWLSGLRLEESLILSWDYESDISVDLRGQYPRLQIWGEAQKSGRDELLPLTPDFGEFLLATPPECREGLVFTVTGQRGGTLTANSVGRVISDLGRQAGIVVDKSHDKFATAHDLRRSFGTRWSKRVKSAVLQKLMRHADIKTTMDYYVDQDADDVASDLWREYGNGPKKGQSGDTSGDTSVSTSKKETRTTT